MIERMMSPSRLPAAPDPDISQPEPRDGFRPTLARNSLQISRSISWPQKLPTPEEEVLHRVVLLNIRRPELAKKKPDAVINCPHCAGNTSRYCY
ncbi:hypothetical protein BaRGS_00001948 [Batillaria attramentaria]|uniref:Uncharacterized protein n=1 Tax=Batillaria attramentaria TaxID=370345 RepID=A0ABD0M6G4_9CAEN